MSDDNQNVLEAYGLPPFSTVLGNEFRERFDLLPAQQYGVACRNVKEECARAESLGAGPFIGGMVPAPNWCENGQPVDAKLDFALGYSGDSQIEFLGPGEGTSFYSDALKGDKPVLHHVGIYQNESEKIEKRLNQAGYKTVISGGVRLGSLFGIQFKYFDTRDELGCYLETLDFYVLGKLPIPVRKPVETLAKLSQAIKWKR